MKPTQLPLFDRTETRQRLAKLRNPLLLLIRVPFGIFREDLPQREPSPKGGRPSLDPLLMFKLLLLQHFYRLSDEQLEYHTADRQSFRDFAGIERVEQVPDFTSVWRFRETINESGGAQPLFAKFETLLVGLGLEATGGQMIDATIVQRGRPQWLKSASDESSNRELEAAAQAKIPPVAVAAAAVESGEAVECTTPAVVDSAPIDRPANESLESTQPLPSDELSERQVIHRDTDARFTLKHGKHYFGYKQHINVDAGRGFIRGVEVTAANVHDGHVLERLIDDPTGRDPRSYADAAYPSKENSALLAKLGVKPRFQHKRKAGQKLTLRQRQENRRWSRTRARVEHVFAQQCSSKPGGRWLFVVGQTRVTTKLVFDALAYNFGRLRWHMKQAQGSCARSVRKSERTG